MGKSFARLTIAIGIVALAACSSGDKDNGTTNRAPTADAGSDQIVAELTTVQLSGSGTDPDAGDTVSFSWSQISGTTVTINNAGSANAEFAAPDVMAGNPQVLGFRLTVTDSAGLTATDDVSITVQQPGPVVTISGNMMYEFPPPLAGCNGLDFLNVETRAIRQATVQALDETATIVLATDITDDTGAYSLTVAASTNVIIRVRAELKKNGSPSWDVQVRNNVDTSPSPPPLAQRPLYVMDSSLMDSGVVDSMLDLTATTGWDTVSMSYTGPRTAAPFSVLDAILRGMELVLTVDPTATFDPLDAFWSPDNTTTEGAGTWDEQIDSGEIGTSFYTDNRLFLLGSDGDDTEEFDDHVIVHEWGHYFEDNFSRSDSIGGAHGVGDLLDKRVAFGEGWATALSGIALNDPQYCDTMWFAGALNGFEIDIESESGGTPGWFNEISIMKLVYDLWDTDGDVGGADNSSIGFLPIYNVFVGPQASTSAFTSIFSFATELKNVSGQDAFINALLAEQDITTNTDIYGSNETNDGAPGSPPDVLPIYTDIALGATSSICVNSQFDDARDGNKLSEHRYLRLNLPATQQVTFTMSAKPAPSMPTPGFDCTADPNDPENHEHSDPDFTVWQDGIFYWFGFSCEPNTETTTTNGALPAGDYVIDINDFRHEDEESPAGYPEQVCFEFTAN